MKAYLHASKAGAKAKVLTQCFIDFADLYSQGFLNENSTIWADAESPDLSFWALTDRSQYVRVIRVTEPGYVRLTKNEVRWSRTFDGTNNDNAEYVLNRKNIPGNNDVHLTLIVKHRVPGKQVKIIEQSRTKELENGAFTFGNGTAIDLAAYRPPEEYVEPTVFEKTHANWHGVEHMMSSIPATNRQWIRDHLEVFQLQLETQLLDTINEYLDQIDKFGDGVAEILLNRVLAAEAS